MVATAMHNDAHCVYLRTSGLLTQTEGMEGAVAVLKLRQKVESFGEVLHVTELAGEEPALLVAYADAWAAAKAREAFAVHVSCDMGCGQQAESTAEPQPGEDEKLFDAAFYCDSSKLEGVMRPPTASTLTVCQDDSEDAASESNSDSSSSDIQTSPCIDRGIKAAAQVTSKPCFLNCMELSQINWNRLAKDQEWRTVLHLRGLPRRLCEPGALEALLEMHGLRSDVDKVKVSSKQVGRSGSAVLHAASADCVARLARFFHGRVFSGSRLPVSVSFASSQDKSQRSQKSALAKLAEPKHVSSSLFDRPAVEGVNPSWVPPPPPGLEHMVAYRPLTMDTLPSMAWTD